MTEVGINLVWNNGSEPRRKVPDPITEFTCFTRLAALDIFFGIHVPPIVCEVRSF
jgi:hypothetical protein